MKRIIVVLMFFFGLFSEQEAYSQCGGSCGGFAGFCWCDDFCWIAGDCCADVCTACGSTGPQYDANCGPPPPPPPPPVPPCGTPTVFNFTGGVQNFVVPPGVTTITIVAEGAQGGDALDNSGGAVPGGLGAYVSVTIPVVPGDVINMNIGGQGGLGTTTGYNGGGSGFFSTDGDINNASASGGGSTNVSINGSPFLIAAGGGGAGGGTWDFWPEDNAGGDGGCATGEAPAPGSPWIGVGGGGGSQVAPGVGGAPWAGVPPGGSSGIGGVGGIGGQWQTAPGGGGGGGYFGGGGGGNDGCCTGANGGAGGGGGSSLVPGGGGCIQGLNAGNGVVTIYIPTPNTMTSPSVAAICSGGTVNIPLTSTIPGSTFEWIATANGNVIGESTTLQTTATLSNLLINTTTAPQVVVYTVTPSTPGCPGTPQTVNVTVNPFPTMTSIVAQTICSGSAVNIPLTTNVAGSTFSWIATANPNVTGESTTAQTTATINNTLTNTTAAVQTVTYTVTPTGPAPSFCVGTAQIVTVTVIPTPSMTSPNAQTICSGSAVNIPLTSNVAGSTFSWIAAANGNVTGESTTAQTTGTINNTLTNTTAAVQTVTYTVTPTGPAPSLCPGTPQTVTVTVNPTPSMTSAAAQTICSGTAVNIPLTSNIAGSTFSWIATANANVTGESTTAQATALINNNLVNTTAVVQTVTYTVTPTGPAPSFCPGTPQTVTVTVNPTPTMTSATAQTICSGTAVNIPLTSNVAGSTFSWIATANANVTGESTTAQATATINDNLVNTTAVVQTVTYTVTPTGPAPSLCPGTPQTVTVTVNPTPAMTSANAQTICSATAVNIPLTSGVAGSTFLWIATANANVTGESTTAQATSTINDNLVNTTAVVQTVTYTVTPTGPAPSLCPGTPQTVTVTVNPTPTMTSPNAQTICSGTAVNIPLTSSVAGATFSWIAAANANVTGESTTAQATATINNNLVNTTAVVQTVTYTVTPTGPAPSLCPGTPQTVTVTVNPTPTMTSANAQTICSGTAVNIPLTSGVAGSTFSWIAAANANVTGESTTAQTTGTINNTLTNTTAVVQTVTYTVTPTGPAPSLCPGTPQTVTITVNPTPPIVVVGVSPTTCAGTDGTITISGLTASTNYNISYNNPGLVGPVVMMSNGAGVITIAGLTAGTYTGFIASAAGCASTSATIITLVDPNPPTVNDPVDQTLCANVGTTAVNFTGTAGATFTWANNTPSIGLGAGGVGNIASFTAINATTAAVIATITVTPSLAGCVGTPQTFTITVNPIPTVTDPADQSLCANSPTTAVNFAGAIPGTTFNWTNSNATIGLVAAGSGNIASFSGLNAAPGTTNTGTITVTPVLAGCTGTPQTFTISVVNTLPTLNCPGNLSAVCSITEQPAYANFAAFTGAGGTANSVGGVIQPATFTLVSEVSNGLTCPETVTRTYSIQDNCGSTATCTQTITVDDNINPTGTAPAAITVQCIGNVPVANPALITDEADNCAPPIVAFVSDVSNGLTCPQTITRTYSITDACGNSINVTQIITVDDNINPTASNPATFNGSAVPAVDITVVIDEADNCSVPVVAFVSDVTDGLNCPETITRTYSVTDACGNQILVTQLIIIGDPFLPTASNPAPVAVQCVALVPASNPAVVIDEADNNGVPVVAFVSDVSNGLTCPETITRTYSVTDVCGNQILVTQTITVDDNINPTGTAPANVNVQCIANVPASNIALITDEADNCATPTVTFIGDVSNGLTCPETITRTYRITDACGNFIDVTQTIVVDDTTNPTASNPVGVTVQCIGDVPASDPTVVIDEADNCSVPTVAFVSDVSDGNICPETITRTYSVTDACGNTINVTQTIIVHDTTNPTASNPATVIVPGGPVPAVDPLDVIDEADNCSVPVVAFVSDVTDGNLCPETITRTYSVTDDCGNQILVTQIIQITDPIMPTASNPVTVNVQCIGQVPAPDVLVVTDELDNNGLCIVAFVSDVSDGNTCPETITRTYSVTDACGNVITVTQLIIVNDTTVPTASNPMAVNVQCIGDVPVSDILVVTDEADNCTVNPVVAFVGDVSDGLTCPETITRTYSVTDDCGNTINVTQTIIVNDTTNPTASNPASVTVECIGDVPASDITVVIDEADNCSVPTILFVSDVSDGNTCPETITRTYSVTDACGNTINVTQTIIVDDTTDPTASNPAGVTVDIIANVPVADPLVVIDEADNCSVPLVAFVSDVSDGNTCPETITRTYSITDACGNSINVTQTIIVSDLILPTASNPAAIAVQCVALVPASDPLVVIDEADNNGVPVVAFVSDVSDGNTCPETITRTYSVTDPCGNAITVTQIITVDDNINPTGTAPANITVQCIGNVPVSNVALITDEADNCAVPTVTFIGDVSNGLTCPETITRTYRITDACGNFIDVAQSIIVDDTTNPTASNPASVTVQCIGDVPASNPSVVIDEADNCSVPVVVFMGDVSDGNTCPETITRTYSVTDACGNFINVTQTIIVDDTTNPTASNPAAINVSCASNVPTADPTVVTTEADNCTANPIVAWVSDVTDGNVCNNETITRTYSVTDNCGNTINVTQQIIIGVTTPSVNAGLDLAVCDGTQVTLTASNPDAAVITWDNGITNATAFTPALGTTVYTVTATQCGGEGFATDQVQVVVNPLPVIAFMADTLIGCAPLEVTFVNQSSILGNNCQWTFGDGSSAMGCDSVTNIYNTTGLFDVTLTVTTLQGCTSTDTYNSYITIAEKPEAEFVYSPIAISVENTEVNFTNNSVNADTYLWDFGDNTGGSAQTDPTHTFPVVGNMSYTVTLTATNYAGCVDIATEIVTIEDVVIFYVPNVFTPDNDNINNTFLPVFISGFDVYDYHLTIFNRWGEVLFESYNATVGWSGTYGNEGLVEDGVYVWQIEFGETMSDKRHKERGHVTVLK